MLNVKKLLTKILDNCVIESGTDNDWVYKKYADGTFEATKQLSERNYTFNTATGSLYSSSAGTIAMPSFVTDILYIAGNCNGANQWISMYAPSTTNQQYAMLSSTSATNQARKVGFYLVGKY